MAYLPNLGSGPFAQRYAIEARAQVGLLSQIRQAASDLVEPVVTVGMNDRWSGLCGQLLQAVALKRR